MIAPVIEHYDAAWRELTAEGSPFAMTETEVLGVPMRVFASAPPTMRSIWEITAFYTDRTYVVYEDERYTYGDIAAQVRALAHRLRDEHGVGRATGSRSRCATTPSGSCRTGRPCRSALRSSA
jgi:long-chain acyl-CoA synthetase